MSAKKSVLILHVPYEHRGGEDVHVDALVQGYAKIGIEPVLFPKDRAAPTKLLGPSLRSLIPTSEFAELDEVWNRINPAYIHIHNVFPLFGPRFFRWAIERKIPMVMTVHNHRFFCTNGLALRDKQICKDCFNSTVSWRPLLYNCNGSWKKSIYHSLALSELRLSDLYKRAIQRFVAPSPYLQAELVRLGIPKNQVIHILNPVFRTENERVAKTPRLHRDSGNNSAPQSTTEAYDVIYAGRLSPEKGIHELIAAIRLLPNVHFAIVGDGPDRAMVEQAAMELKNLHFLGAVSHEAVLDLVAQSQIAVLPSICNETLSTFALEAFFQGKRCVVPALDSTSWLASGDFPGHLARAGDPQDLARAINEALTSNAIGLQQIETLQTRLGFNRFCSELKALALSMDGGA